MLHKIVAKVRVAGEENNVSFRTKISFHCFYSVLSVIEQDDRKEIFE